MPDQFNRPTQEDVIAQQLQELNMQQQVANLQNQITQPVSLPQQIPGDQRFRDLRAQVPQGRITQQLQAAGGQQVVNPFQILQDKLMGLQGIGGSTAGGLPGFGDLSGLGLTQPPQQQITQQADPVAAAAAVEPPTGSQGPIGPAGIQAAPFGVGDPVTQLLNPVAAGQQQLGAIRADRSNPALDAALLAIGEDPGVQSAEPPVPQPGASPEELAARAEFARQGTLDTQQAPPAGSQEGIGIPSPAQEAIEATQQIGGLGAIQQDVPPDAAQQGAPQPPALADDPTRSALRGDELSRLKGVAEAAVAAGAFDPNDPAFAQLPAGTKFNMMRKQSIGDNLRARNGVIGFGGGGGGFPAQDGMNMAFVNALFGSGGAMPGGMAGAFGPTAIASPRSNTGMGGGVGGGNLAGMMSRLDPRVRAQLQGKVMEKALGLGGMSEMDKLQFQRETQQQGQQFQAGQADRTRQQQLADRADDRRFDLEKEQLRGQNAQDLAVVQANIKNDAAVGIGADASQNITRQAQDLVKATFKASGKMDMLQDPATWGQSVQSARWFISEQMYPGKTPMPDMDNVYARRVFMDRIEKNLKSDQLLGSDESIGFDSINSMWEKQKSNPEGLQLLARDLKRWFNYAEKNRPEEMAAFDKAVKSSRRGNMSPAGLIRNKNMSVESVLFNLRGEQQNNIEQTGG
jgi:hypothetical protein